MEKWRLPTVSLLLWISLVYQGLEFCNSLNEEGMALLVFKERVEEDPYGALSKWDEMATNPCSWFGVECSSDERVLALTLKDLSLKGILTSDLGKLIHVKTLILHNNSFYGSIPVEIGRLQKLEVLDLGHNNLSGPVPADLENIFSLELLILKSNSFISDISPQLYELSILSEIQADEELLSSNRMYVTMNVKSFTMRRILSIKSGSDIPPNEKENSKSANTTDPPPPTPQQLNQTPPAPSHSPPGPDNGSNGTQDHHKDSLILPVSIAAALSLLFALLALFLIFFRSNKVVSPWRTGLSGQLQKALTSRAPSLKRSELETACENFSNVIGSLSSCSLYKGTLSNGVEIAVTSTMVKSAKDWSNQYEEHFRKKISLFSRVNHKNFMNLLGHCKEEEPFTRMMVFEYASNGTLFEHLHIKEAEHLDWAARMRIIMGIVYCLVHMEQLDPPLTFSNLHSNSIYLTEDYAAKISDLDFWIQEEKAEPTSESANKESVVYKFAIILLEIISGRLPFSEDDGLLVLWASGYLDGRRPLIDMVDPTLKSVSSEDLSELVDVIQSCISVNPEERPTIAEVSERMSLITSISPEQACPRLSPLWWAELEIISS